MRTWNKWMYTAIAGMGLTGLHAGQVPLEANKFIEISIQEKGPEDKSREVLLQLLAGEWISRCIFVAAKLEIADHLEESPMSAKDLAELTHTNPDSLYRIIRLLSSVGVFEEKEDGVFSNNHVSLLLSKRNPDTLRAYTLLFGEVHHQSLDQMLRSVKEGVPAFDLATQQPIFSYLKENPGYAQIFQMAMREKSKAVIQSAIESYDFGKFQSVYDIGGGFGHFVQALLARYPYMKGMVFELPEVVPNISKNNPGLQTERCELCSGDFFKAVPAGDGAYLLKSILHDWDDDKAIQILKNCHEAMSAASRLVIVDIVLMPGGQKSYANFMDVLMMEMVGGRERTLAAFENILENSGFVLESIHSTSTEFSIIEARKK